MHLQNQWAADIAFATQQGFRWSASGAPAHTVAHVGMLALMFASAEQRQDGKVQLVHGLDCFALDLVRSPARVCITEVWCMGPAGLGDEAKVACRHHSAKQKSKYQGLGRTPCVCQAWSPSGWVP